MAKTPAPGARTGETPPTPDNGNVDLTTLTGKADEQKPDPLLDTFEAKKADDATVAPGSDGTNVRKVTVSTTGDFMYQDPYTLEVVESEGTHEIIYTSAVQLGLDDGRLIEA